MMCMDKGQIQISKCESSQVPLDDDDFDGVDVADDDFMMIMIYGDADDEYSHTQMGVKCKCQSVRVSKIPWDRNLFR